MDELPPDLLVTLPEGARPVAEQWWASLPDFDRSRLAGLWDERLEVCFFAPQVDEAGSVDAWEQVPTVQGGWFVPTDDDGRSEWEPGYFEHLLQHPELVLAYGTTAPHVSHRLYSARGGPSVHDSRQRADPVRVPRGFGVVSVEAFAWVAANQAPQPLLA